MVGYNKNVLKKIAKDRGYQKDKALIGAIAKELGVGRSAAYARLEEKTRFSFAESFVLASYFEMTPKEYAACFLDGLFVRNSTGHFIAHVADKKEILERTSQWTKYRMKAEKRKEEERREMMEEIEEL